MKTNLALVSPIIRTLYADELLCLRRANRKLKYSWRSPEMTFAKTGLETGYRRMQRMVTLGYLSREIDPRGIFYTEASL